MDELSENARAGFEEDDISKRKRDDGDESEESNDPKISKTST